MGIAAWTATNIAIPATGIVDLSSYVPAAKAIQITVKAAIWTGSYAWVAVDGITACQGTSQTAGTIGNCAASILLSPGAHTFSASGNSYSAAITGYF